jgi:Homeodomain-like domain/Integrase core domain
VPPVPPRNDDHPSSPDPTQQRYERLRPLLLLSEGTARAQGEPTQTHPETLRALKRRFAQQGLVGLLPKTLKVVPVGRRRRTPDAVVTELQRLTGLYDGFGYRELARILFHTVGHRLHHQTVQDLWHQLAPARPPQLPLLDYHSYPERTDARRQVLTLYAQGWSKRSISQFLRVSRPTITRWITRFEADELASLEDHSCAPKSPGRKAWLPVMVEIYHLQKRHPDAGGFRIWSLRGKLDLSVRTVERIMAVNRQVYPDIPLGGWRRPRQTAPGPHPFKAAAAHEYWFIDGRIMDFTLEGTKWWSLIVLDGYSRTMLAGCIAPVEASWGALLVLHAACRRYGAPQHLISDKGGAYISEAFEAVCQGLAIDHKTITSTQGESYMNLMESHFNIQRRLYDYQFALTRTPEEFEQAHQAFLQLYNTTAHQGLLQEHFHPPIPLQVLGEAKGRSYTPEVLQRLFAHALFTRTTNRYGCVTLHHTRFYVAEGLPQTSVLLWVYEQEVRAVFDTVVLATYPCRYDPHHGSVSALGPGRVARTRFVSPQGTLLARTAHELVVLVPPSSRRLPVHTPTLAQQLGLFPQEGETTRLAAGAETAC